ncbi:MAG: futalosine hydrolase [Planctomycetaceae bacterium]
MSTNLVLVPTDLERTLVAPALGTALGGRGRLELCGFGPIAAAARTAALIASHAPDRVLLVGIAGRLGAALAIGAAYRFDRVACHGVGAGSGDAFVPASALGWPQWAGDPATAGDAIGDVIDLPDSRSASALSGGLLLTACASSATLDEVASRRKLFPTAMAEDMEGFGVALACRLHGVPLAIVRGISNDAGDRDHARWQMTAALDAAVDLVLQVLEEPP